MGIARHEHVLILFTLLDELIEEYFHTFSHLHQFMAGKEFQVHQHLVIARTPRMDFLSHIT